MTFVSSASTPKSDLANRALYSPPAGYAGVRVVGSFAELVATPFGNGVNALCWPRRLDGDFDEIVAKLGGVEEITTLDDDDLRALTVSPAGQRAREGLLEDVRLLREQGLAPSLDCIPAYPRDDGSGPVPTDVYSYHADSANTIADTYLCSYTVVSSEGLRNEDAIACADLPETRAELLKQYGGADDDGFRVFLNENFFDLHYVARPGALPFSFGLGNLWRIATQYPGSPVPPCVHRAPETRPGQPPRLLLIS
jgi:hypothetical protein